MLDLVCVTVIRHAHRLGLWDVPPMSNPGYDFIGQAGLTGLNGAAWWCPYSTATPVNKLSEFPPPYP